tara:strand:+ start:75 stop:764 length:690 start_codon:yes stop_codon:yes gene_type:complete
MNIVFGQKRLVSVAARNTSIVKYPEQAVITVEGIKGAKKSRRILMNAKAAQYLDLVVGEVENIVFAPVDDTQQILIANTSTIDGDAGEMVSYSTSKNNVTFSETTEKGKGITSSHMCKEIFKFLGEDETSDMEFELAVFPSESITAFSLCKIDAALESIADTIETNNEVLTTEEVVSSVQNEVAQAEAENPIFEQEEVAEEVIAEEVVEEVVAEETPAFQRREEITQDW